MGTSLEGEFAEPIQEHAQFAQIIKQVLKFRHMKHVQNEARRLEEAMTRERTIGSNAINVDEMNDDQQQQQQQQPPEENPYALPANYNNNRPPVRSSSNGWAGGPMKVISAVGHTLQNIIDVNPEATRRNQIGMSKDAMGVLQEALDITRTDLTAISSELQADLDRFQTEKIQDMRDMLIAYAKIHIRYCQKNLESWQEARAEVEKIPI
ncbi:hypothetical protein G6F42_026941 [Rhizopus arrhizus]|nr:hypothetical protein G6F42_026941 [Rhizopus arrhizus]